MNCQSACEKLGAYLDGALTAKQNAELEGHIRTCRTCAAELEQLRTLVERLSEPGKEPSLEAPPQLWSAIEQRLDTPLPHSPQKRVLHVFRRPLALAASLALFIGIAAFMGFWLSSGVQTAQATVIDYSVLLDGLTTDVDAAVQRFFDYYKAEPIEAAKASAAAPALSFAIPPELPGGYRLEKTYRLKFDNTPGVAARYRRGREPLMVFFHTPVARTEFGVHRESQCHVAGREGQRVEVGLWRLIHFTDPTTCHCLLSKLDKESEIFAIMQSIAPEFSNKTDMPH